MTKAVFISVYSRGEIIINIDRLGVISVTPSLFFVVFFVAPILNINTNLNSRLRLFHTNSNALTAERYSILKDSCNAVSYHFRIISLFIDLIQPVCCCSSASVEYQIFPLPILCWMSHSIDRQITHIFRETVRERTAHQQYQSCSQTAKAIFLIAAAGDLNHLNKLLPEFLLPKIAKQWH